LVLRTVQFILSIVISVIDGFMGNLDSEAGIGLLGGIYTLALLLPGFAVSVRRLHDTDRSGRWLFIALVPILGAIVLLVFMTEEGESGTNQYGTNPKLV
jgi:uncharacterized membrane protein YhaH (DUF805 family)